MEGIRERLKRVEKTVYERVEQEYSIILSEKDQQIGRLEDTISDLEQQILRVKDDINSERAHQEIASHSLKVQQHHLLLEHQEAVHSSLSSLQEKELRVQKERLTQDYEFRLSQIEQTYTQKINKLKTQLREEKHRFVEDKSREFRSMGETEL